MSRYDLRTDGPHSTEYTHHLGEALAEAARTLNYATRGGAGGLECVPDVYGLLGWLYTTTERLPQLFDQLSEFLRAQARDADLGDSDRDPDLSPEAQALIGADHLREASQMLYHVTRSLHDAQNIIAGLYVKEDHDA